MIFRTPKLVQWGFLAYSRLTRGMTLGVRAILIKDDAVLLVRHTYTPGWHFPGGGVEAYESATEAVRREAREEAGAEFDQPPELFGIYRHRAVDRRDHVVVYVSRHFSRTPLKLPSLEIAAADLFPLDALPEGTTRATRARLGELLNGEPLTVDW